MSLFSCQYSYLPLFDHRGIYRAKSIGQICQKRPVTKKLPLLGALSFNGAGERTSAYPLRGSAPASPACRRTRQLAKNAPRFLDARSFAGSSPRDEPITKKLPLLGALSFNGAGERTSAYPLRGSAPASPACRRTRQLAKNAPRFLDARSFAGSSPRDEPITKKLPLLGALSFNGAGERT